MAKSFLLKPDNIRQGLRQRYNRHHKAWLTGAETWPLILPLGIPTEKQAYPLLNQVMQWQQSWLDWNGVGDIQWVERHWTKLGTQKLPEKISIADPTQIAHWIGEQQAWDNARQRYQTLTRNWPGLAPGLAKYFKVLAHYTTADFDRLHTTLQWLQAHPDCNLYPRQLPIEGIDTKWLKDRQSMITDLLKNIRNTDQADFYSITGLRRKPTLIRLRILDDPLRRHIGGLSDIAISLDDLRKLSLPAKKIYIVENLETGLAFDDIADSILIIGLGYAVDLLRDIPLLTETLQNKTPIIYWGDIDTDGFAILNRLRHYFPHTQSALMDQSTLLKHQPLWGQDETPKTNPLPMLTEQEKTLYDDLCNHRWRKNLRLEQERIAWKYAWEKLQRIGNESY